ncbi:MAG: hypothetical protein JKY37_20820 [Nannocystaceae bacterium]|nr:hypothetical protein [Nannocystaceae bacterium]
MSVEDISFGYDREIMLPGRRHEEGDIDVEDTATGLVVVAAIMDFIVASEENLVLLIAGHSDSKGDKVFNEKLSRRRAENVNLYVAGQRSDWAAHCVENDTIADVQEVLIWATEMIGWACHPGTVDGDLGQATVDALAEFRRTYNFEFDKALKEKGPIIAADWEAVYDLYDRALAEHLGMDTPELEPLKKSVGRCDPPLIACGELWPREAVGDNTRNPRNRRVDLLAYRTDHTPDLANDDVAGDSIYGARSRHRHHAIPVSNIGSLFVSFTLCDATGNPIANAVYRLQSGEAELTGSSGSDGRFTVSAFALEDEVTLEWRHSDEGDFSYTSQHRLAKVGEPDEPETRVLLSNLGFDRHDELRSNVLDFQDALDLVPTGQVAHIASLLEEWNRTGTIPDKPDEDDVEDPPMGDESVLVVDELTDDE